MKKSLVRAFSQSGHLVTPRILMFIGLWLASGCVSQAPVVTGEMYASRGPAYQSWRQPHESQADREAFLQGELSIEDAIKVALTHNKSLQATLEEQEVARGRVVESYSEVLPQVNATAAYTRLDEVTSFDVAGQRVSFGAVDDYSFGLRVRQPLFRGGATRAALRAARAFRSLTDERVRGAIQATVHDVASAYYETLLAQHLYAVSEDAVRSAQMQLDNVKRKRDEGVAPEYDVLRAQVEVSNFRAEMIQRRNRIHLAKTRLFNKMGVSQRSDVTLSGKLTYRPVEPILEEAIRVAYKNRPDLSQAELGIRLQNEALRVAKSRYWPKLDAVFGQRWTRPDPHSPMTIDWGDAWQTGIVAEWPLFDGLQREGRIIQERAMLKQRKTELLSTEERIQLEVQQAILSLRDADEFVESQLLNLERAKEALRLVEALYREGISTEVEVTDARAALTRAMGLYYQAIYAHTIADLNLQLATGTLGPKPGHHSTAEEGIAEP